MDNSIGRRMILTHWNAGVFEQSTLPQLLPELVIYSLLYDDVFVREEDLITNRPLIRFLSQPHHRQIFDEFLAAGLVKLLRMPLDDPTGRRFDPERLPVSARAEEHQLRRSYKGKPWKPTAGERQFFQAMDATISAHPAASRFHAPFPIGNPFAEELAELLEHRDAYREAGHRVFRYLHPRTADAFIEFCREPEAWQRFLRDAGIESFIEGPDGGFYRTAAYQCLQFLPRARSMQTLVESVYAATYCDRTGF